MAKPDLAAAIAEIKDSRQTHADWIEWMQENPDEPHPNVESIEENQRIVAAYDNVLACLRLRYPRGRNTW